MRRYQDLPAATRHYLERVEALAGVPLQIISVGPDPGGDHNCEPSFRLIIKKFPSRFEVDGLDIGKLP